MAIDRHFADWKVKERGSLTSRNRDMQNRENPKCEIETWRIYQRSRLGESRCFATGIFDMQNHEMLKYKMPKCSKLVQLSSFFWSFEDRDLESGDASQKDCRNAKM
jgi:hypothetical protein